MSGHYAAGQRWRFTSSLPQFEQTLVIGHSVDPTECAGLAFSGTQYWVYVRYGPSAGVWPGIDGVNLSLTADALDRCVTELLEEGVKLPEWSVFGQEHDLPGRPRASKLVMCDELEQGLAALLQAEQLREQGRRQIAATVSRDEVLRQLAPWRETHKRLAWTPIIASGDSDLVASKFSGTPWLAEGEAWPTCVRCRRPMQLLLQLNLSELPAELERRCGSGLLQLFACSFSPYDALGCNLNERYEPFGMGKLVRIVHPQAGSRKSLSAERRFPARTIADWRMVDDYPSSHEHQELGLKYDYDFNRDTVRVSCIEPKLLFENQVSWGLAEAISDALPGDKLAGWPSWLGDADYPLCPTCHRRMQMLFQLDTSDVRDNSKVNLPLIFGDLARGHISQCPDHTEVVTFSCKLY